MPIETGYVQKLTSFSGPSTCAWVGSTPTSSELLVIAAQSGDGAAQQAHKEAMAALLTHACLTGRLVEVSHAEGSATVTMVAYPAGRTSSQPLQMDGFEVTQGIQDLSHSVPLVAGKRTVARAYLSYYGAAPISVSGEVTVRSTSGAAVTVSSQNTVTLIPADAGDVTTTRNDGSRSLNFLLPPAATTAGDRAFELSKLIDVSSGDVIDVGNKRRPIIGFQPSAPLRLKIIRITYQMGSPPITYQPSDLDFNLLVSWLRRVYPADQVIVSSATVAATASVPFTRFSINSQLAALRAADVSAGNDNRTHYYGLVSDGGFFMRGGAAGIPTNPDPTVVACGPTGPGSWGWDFDGSYGDWYGGHELGHTLGRSHPGFCGESTSDLLGYPFPNGQISSDDRGFCGFDVGDPANSIGMAARPAPQWRDVMTYCNFQWISPYTYEGIRRRLLAEDAMAAGAGSGGAASAGSGGRPDARYPTESRVDVESEGGAPDDVSAVPVSVVAVLNLTERSGKISFVTPVPGVEASPAAPTSPVSLRVSNADGTTLHVTSVPVKVDSELDPDEDQIALLDAVIMAPGGSRVIELLIDENVVDTFRSEGPPPTVRGLRASSAGPDRLQVSAVLEGFRSEKGNSFLVQASTDGGATWQTLAMGLDQPSVTIDRRQFESGKTVRLRVLATNGFATSLAATESFET